MKNKNKQDLTVKELRFIVKQMGGKVTSNGKYKTKLDLLWEIRLNRAKNTLF